MAKKAPKKKPARQAIKELPVQGMPIIPETRYGFSFTHPFMGKNHGRKRQKGDVVPMNFSCNTTEIGGSLYNSHMGSMLKMLESFDLIPIDSTIDNRIELKAYIKAHKGGPLKFFGMFAEIPQALIDFCKQHKLSFRIWEWPSAEPDSGFRVHTFLPDESNTLFSSRSGIDGLGWMNRQQVENVVANGKIPNDGYFAAHEKQIPDFKFSSW